MDTLVVYSMHFFFSSLAVIVLVLLGYTVFSYLRIQGLIRESQILVRSSATYQKIVSGATTRVLFMGDSTGVGVGATRGEDSLAGRLSQDHTDWSIENVSVSGRKTAELIPVLEVLGTHQYDQIIIQIGGNDITYFSDRDTLAGDIAIVLQEAKRVSPQVILLTSGNVGNAPILPRPLAFLWHRRTLQVRDIFMKAAEERGVTYVDLYRDKKTDPFFLEPYRYHASDLFHPSSEGYGLWYQDLKKAL